MIYYGIFTINNNHKNGLLTKLLIVKQMKFEVNESENIIVLYYIKHLAKQFYSARCFNLFI